MKSVIKMKTNYRVNNDAKQHNFNIINILKVFVKNVEKCKFI